MLKEDCQHSKASDPRLPPWNGTQEDLQNSHARLVALLVIQGVEVRLGYLASHLQEAESINAPAVRRVLELLGGHIKDAYPLDGPVSSAPLAQALREVVAA